MAAAMKHMASNFAKLEKFEGRMEVRIQLWIKSRKRAKWDNNDYVYRGLILNGMSDPLFDVYQNVETSKELWDTLEAKYMSEDDSSKKFLVSNFTNYKMTDSRPVLEQYNELLGIIERFTQHKINMDESIQVSCIIDKLPSSWKDFKHTLKHLKEELTLIKLGSHLRIKDSLKAQDNDKPKGNNVVGPSVFNMVEHNNSFRYNDNKGKHKHHGTRATPNKKPKIIYWKCGKPEHLKKDCKDGNVGNRANGSSTKGSKDGSSNPLKAFLSTSKMNDLILWHARLGHVHFKRMQDMSKDGLIPAFDMDTGKCQTCMLNKITKKPFQNVKRETKVLELIHSDLCDLHATPSLGNRKYFVTFIDDALRTDRGGEYMDTLYFQSVGIIHETTAPYTLQQNGISERKNRVLKEMVNFMLSYSGLSQGFWVVRLPDLKLKTLGERGIECIFVGYAEQSKAFKFYVIEPNDSVAINLIIELKDAIFDEHMFSSIPRPSQRSLVKRTEDSGGSVASERVTDKISQDVSFWKKAINDEMDSIMGNNTWVLTDLSPGCRPVGCKWIFKRKLKVDGTIEKFKARLVIQGFKQKSGIDYFDTYAPVARISTIRLLIAIASIHNLIIHQNDLKTTFLNGELEEEVYMNQPMGFILPGNEKKVCKLVKSLYELKQAPKQWHQKFDEVVLSNGYLLNQADKCVYSKFDTSGKGVIICLYVDDMLIFDTDQVQVDLTKEFFISRFSMKDMGEADVILGIRIKHESNGIAISQSHYIEKVLKKFNYSDCTPVSTTLDTCEKLMPNRGLAVSQLDSRVIGTQHWQATQRVMKYLKKTMDYRLVYSGYISVLEGYTDASWISNTEDNSSTSGWVFLLGGGAISWASKKQTCITGSTMEYEFVALEAAGKEAECTATLAKAYSQMYNGKSRHLGVRHSMIHELITNRVVSIEFVRSQQNLADHLTKGLARDLVIKSAKGIGLKFN
ncbi:zinc finger, CCHC-type containing protein [Tanacetum coccineum]